MLALVLSAVLSAAGADASVAFNARQPAPELTQTAATATTPELSSVAVTLECTAYASGRVGACNVMQETHPGMGFGEAAIALMRDVEVAPGPRDVQFARTFQFVP